MARARWQTCAKGVRAGRVRVSACVCVYACVSAHEWRVRAFSMEFPIQIKQRAFNPVKLLASPKRVFGLITATLTFLTFARIVVCLVEAYSAVRHERYEDEGLMRLCNDPTSEAAVSPDMRALCLRKRAERAAPIVFKAVLRAVTTAFTEFCEVFSSPSRVALLVLFSITGIAAPVVKALVALFVQSLRRRRLKRNGAKYATSDSEDTDDDGEEESHFQVVEISPRHGYNTRKSLMRRLTMPRMTSLI